MKLLLDRKWKKSTYTIGVLYVNGERFCETIEDKDRGLTDDMNESDIKKKKVYGETAIPAGTYEVVLSYSPKFGKRSWAKKYGGKIPEVKHVKGFSGIRMHPGNTAKDSLGCILPGRNLEKGKVLKSLSTFKSLMDKHLVPAASKGEKIELTIQ